MRKPITIDVANSSIVWLSFATNGTYGIGSVAVDSDEEVTITTTPKSTATTNAATTTIPVTTATTNSAATASALTTNTKETTATVPAETVTVTVTVPNPGTTVTTTAGGGQPVETIVINVSKLHSKI